jgi:hypothetical protein
MADQDRGETAGNGGGLPTSSTACLRCGGETARGTVKAGNHEAQVVIAGKPDGFLGVIPYTTTPVGARVCTVCGHIELFARDPRNLLTIESGDESRNG